MSVSNSPRPEPPSGQVNPRSGLLSRLADAVRSRGGTALVALSATAHPVLYVRTGGRTLPVVAVPGSGGGWWFIWGRTGYADSADVEQAAAALCPARRMRANLVAARRARLRRTA